MLLLFRVSKWFSGSRLGVLHVIICKCVVQRGVAPMQCSSSIVVRSSYIHIRLHAPVLRVHMYVRDENNTRKDSK